ncbi:MAG: GNAT family N-acetyltransferase [Chloroflexota bacterium]
MYELTQTQFERTRSLFAPLLHHLAAESILSGLTPGRLFVDDSNKPRTAVAWFQHRVYLAGNRSDDNVNQALHRLFSDVFYPEMCAAGLAQSAYTLCYTPGWERVIDVILTGKYPMTGQRYYYRLDPTRRSWQPKLPKEFKLRAVDAELLADTRLINLDYVTDEMVSERPSVADFLDKSFGACIVQQDRIVGWCMSEYNLNGRCELGIATDPAYQRQGLAQAAASAVIGEAVHRGYTEIGWVCDADNTPSMALAQKLGFALVHADDTYFAFFDPILNLGINGNIHLRHQNYQEAVVWYQKAINQGDAPVWLWWNCAAAWANLGSQAQTFSCLNHLLDAGFDDRAQLENSDHFRPYRRTKEWSGLLARFSR